MIRSDQELRSLNLQSVAGRRRLAAAVRSGRLDHVDPLELGEAYAAGLASAERRARGAHFTPRALVEPAVVAVLTRPWRQRLRVAGPEELVEAARELAGLRVLDPAVGGGAFLVVVLGELLALEREVASRLGRPLGAVGAHQLLGVDVDPAALEVAGLAVELAVRQQGASGVPELRSGDALTEPWPRADVIVGNPPFLSKNRLHRVLGRARVEELRARYPEVPGTADYCVYWFARAHAELPEGGRAALVGTDTVRQTTSRRGALDRIVAAGTLTDAVVDLPWPGAAGVRVCVVAWRAGPPEGPARLTRDGRTVELPRLHASLTGSVDTTSARPLAQNRAPKLCFQGITPGHPGLVLTREEAADLVAEDPSVREVLHAYLRATDLVRRRVVRWVVDLHPRSLDAVPAVLRRRLERTVLPDREARAAAERERNAWARGAHHHARFLEHWWWPAWPRPALRLATAGLTRLLVTPRYGLPAPVFVPVTTRPSDLLQVFALDDDWSLGVLASSVHREWLEARCSTLFTTPRYTSTTVWDAFPWPHPDRELVLPVVEAARELALARGLGRDVAGPQARVDAAVRRAYGLAPGAEALPLLLALNRDGGSPPPGPPPGWDDLRTDDLHPLEGLTLG